MYTLSTSISTDLHVEHLPEIFARFREQVGERHWQKRVSQLKTEVRRNPFLDGYLHQEYEITVGLDAASDLTRRYGEIPVQGIDCRHVYSAMALAAQVLSIVDSSPHKVGNELVHRVRGALRNPDDMRGLRLELVAATHFTRRGHKVVWPETQGMGTMDLLIEDLGPSGLEVECKSISSDKGLKVRRIDALEFWHLLSPQLKRITDRLTTGLALVITLPGRLPRDFQSRQKLAKDVASSLLLGKSIYYLSGATVRMAEFDLTLLDSIGSSSPQEVLRPILDPLTQTDNKEIMIVGRKTGGAIAAVLQSAEEDTFLPSVFRTLSDSASRQFSKTRAGLFLVGFHGIDATSLLSVVEQDNDPNEPPTSLTRHVSKFLSSENRDHVVGVGFMSKSGLQPRNDAVTDSGGSTYIFSKKESPFWHDDFDSLFRPY